METKFESRQTTRKAKQTERRSFYQWLIAVFIAALLLRFFVIEIIYVEGPSMQPTLHTGERVLLDKISYRFSTPARFDIIVCQFPGEEGIFVKRVIGLPGETVEIKNGRVHINGNLLDDEAYANGVSRSDFEPVVVPEDCVYVLGDNRGNSTDSRFVGCIPYSSVRGKVIWVLWPLSEFGSP